MLSYVFLLFLYACLVFFYFWWELICFLLFTLLLVLSSIYFLDFFGMLGFGWGADYLSVNLLILGIWISFLMLVASTQVWWCQFGSNLFMFSVCFLLLFIYLFCFY